MTTKLVTTAIEETWGDLERLYFLGEWCKLYDRRDAWGKRNHYTLPYHWADRTKIRRDYDYLDQLFEVALEALSIKLNSLHKVNYPTRYWRIVLGPWLLTYLAVAWDRWESLRLAFEQCSVDEMSILNINPLDVTPRDCNDFMECINNDAWNHLLFNNIIDFKNYGSNILITKPRLKANELPKKSSTPKPSWKGKTLNKFIALFDLFLGMVQKKYDVILATSYLSYWSLIKLSIFIGQLPRLHIDLFEDPDLPKPDSRDHLELVWNPTNEFEQFLGKNIFSQIPVAYLEGFNIYNDKATKIKKDASIIFSENKHAYCELFKFWTALQVIRGTKLITSQHGGSLTTAMAFAYHEEKISDKRVTWHPPFESNQIQLSPLKIIDWKFKNYQKKHVLLIGYDLPVYSHRCQSGPGAGLFLEDYQQNIVFCNNLSPSVQSTLIIRPHENRGWNTRQRYIDDLGEDKISPYRSVRDAIGNSKIVICTYPHTAFLEAMFSSVPTILLFVEHYWELRPEFTELIRKMKDANIIFADPDVAAQHVNLIYENPNFWWENEKVTLVRQYFFDMCGKVGTDWLTEWAIFLKDELKQAKEIN